MDEARSNHCSDVNLDNELETFEYDESHSTQLMSREIMGRRRRGVYGRRNSAAVNPTRNNSQHQRSRTADESALAKNLSSNFGIQPDQNSIPFISHLGPDAFSKGPQFGGVGMTIASNANNENAHPNLKRQESLSFSSTRSTSCFTSLSRTASVTNENSSINFNSSSSLIPLQFPSESRDLASSATSYTSPSNKTALSRKRGVCDSPVIHTDDLSSHGGISVSRNSTSSYGSTRRARSRIFSPGSTKKMIDAERAAEIYDIPPYSETARRHHEECFNESDTEDEGDRDTSIMLSTSTDAAGNEDADESLIHNSIDLDRPSMRLRRLSSVGSKGLFQPPIEINSGTVVPHDQVFASMSSYEDLKFLTRELRKWNSGKQATVFGSMKRLCTIVLPSKWGHERKMDFNRWVTSYLKFTLRSGGGNVSYLQTSQSNGEIVLKELEAALLSYKECAKGNRPKPCKNFSTFSPPPMSSIKISHSISTPMMPSLRRRSLTTPSILPSLRSSLTKCFRQTPMSIDTPSPYYNSMRDVVEKLDSMDIAEHNNECDMATEAPLHRIVTLATDDIVASGRPSHDSFMNPGDYLSQMGISPRFNASESIRPAPLTFSTKKNFSAMNMMSPCVRTNPIMSLDAECVETPMPKDDFLKWGSRPIEGKDWGESTQCDSRIIDALTVMFEDRRKNASCPTPDIEPINNGTASKRERHASSPFQEMALSRANSIALGFDDEADDDCCTVTTEVCEEEIDDEIKSQENTTVATSRKTTVTSMRANKRREKSVAKRTRMSICESSLASPRPFRLSSVHSRPSFAFCDTITRPRMDKLQTLKESTISYIGQKIFDTDLNQRDECTETFSTHKILVQVFSYLTEYDLLCSASLVSSSWADAVTDAHASLMLMSVGCSSSFAYSEGDECDELEIHDEDEHGMSIDKNSAVVQSMKRSWDYLVQRFPWGMFLSEGTFKRVFKVWNSNVNAVEAISVMNVDQIENLNVVGSELAVSVMLSSMVRRNICPNFVLVRGVFTSEYEPSPLHWGSADNKKPLGSYYDTSQRYGKPRKPLDTEKGSFQYIRMELCKHGDVEEYIKKQKDSVLSPSDSRALLFQMAFSLYVAGNKFGMKHYDVKLLNFFLDDTNDVSICADEHPYTVLRYGLGSHIFNVRMKTASAVLAKLADFGTANVRADFNGQPVLIGNFTTLENTPPDYMILGDTATQGYGHDCFGLGLCMLHLFTGHAPYEEILDTVCCPPNLKKKMKSIWENHKTSGYEVIRNVIRCDVYEDEEGNIIEGEVDETLYDTLYRFLVLFGIPPEKFQWRESNRVWRAIESCLGSEDAPLPVRKSKRNAVNISIIRKEGADSAQYMNDCKIFSVSRGTNEHIARARNNLKSFNGGMDLLLSLVSFDPKKRASPLDVLNSTFMETLREGNEAQELLDNNIVYSYMSHSL